MSTPPSTPAPATVTPPSLEALAIAKEKAINEELAKLPTIETLEKEIRAINDKRAELERLQDLKLNFGQDRPGRKMFDLPALPRGLGDVTVNGKPMVGKMALTHAEYQNWNSLYGRRIDHEQKSRFGEGGVSNYELMALVNSGRSGQGAVQVSMTGETAKF